MFIIVNDLAWMLKTEYISRVQLNVRSYIKYLWEKSIAFSR